MGLIKLATERRITILMFVVAVLLFGSVSLSRLKLNLLPDLSYPTLTIRTELTGAAPQEIENLLSKPIEEAVGIIKNVRTVRSVSRSGQSDVVLEFAWGTDMDFASVDVREKLDVIELPLDARRPALLRFDPSGEPIMRLGIVEKAADAAAGASALATAQSRLKALRRLAEDQVKNDLEAVEGTAAVKISGGLEDEIQILVDQQKLAQLGISIATVAARIRAENVNLSGGRLEQGSQRFLVRTINEFKSVDEIGASIIAATNGQSVYLRDIAQVVRGFKQREAITRVNGAESVELAIYKEGDANTVLVAARIEKRLERLRETLPDGLELVSVYDQSRFISDAIGQVRSAAIIGGVLAILVLYFFLRDVRATLIIGVTMPVSVIGTFVLMYAADISLNIMSLGGIALAVGLLVDNSIVVLENIVRKKEQGLDLLEAARAGTSEVATAVTAATLTTVAVFFPMVFVSGIAGQLFRDQALTVTFALLFSLIVALTLIPTLAAWRAAPRYADATDSRPPGRFTRGVAAVLRAIVSAIALVGRLLGLLLAPLVFVFQGLHRSLDAIYAPLLRFSLRNRVLVILVAAAVFAATMLLVPRLGVELIPQLSQGEFAVDLRLAPGATLEQTDRALSAVQRAATDAPGIELTYSVAGTGNRLDASPVDSGEHTGQLSIRLTEGADRVSEDGAIATIRQGLSRLPGVQYEFSRPALFSFKTPLEIEISGYGLDNLAAVSNRLVSAMQASNRFADVRTTVQIGNPEVQVFFDQERAARLGLTVRDIADVVVAKVRGEIATRYTWEDKKIDVLVRSVNTDEASVDEIRQLIVNPASSRPVTLEAVAEIRVAKGPAEIRRADQERVAIVSANIAFGDLGAAARELDALIARVPMPAATTARVSGQNAEMRESFTSMQFALAMAIFLVYLVMAAQFESILHPFAIMFTIPLALVGAVLALYLTGTTLSVVVFIGVIMLSGIVVNNAIVLIDLVNQLRADGAAKHVAIMEAGRLRLRPILMTTLTTALGLTPMAIGIGEGAEVRAPMAITVIGGLLVSTLLTLLVIPVVYSLIDRERSSAGLADLSGQQSGATP